MNTRECKKLMLFETNRKENIIWPIREATRCPNVVEL